jgi:hypothetical protein
MHIYDILLSHINTHTSTKQTPTHQINNQSSSRAPTNKRTHLLLTFFANSFHKTATMPPILFKNVAVAFVNEALVPWIVREWCEQREDAAAVDLLERLAKHNKELNAGEMNEFVQSIKKQRLEELEECVEIGKSPEFLFAEELNRYRFKHFDAHIEFQEKHIRPWIKETNDTSFIEKNSPVSASSEGKEEEKQQNVRNSSPDPFDMIIRSTNKSKLEGKSSSFSHLRRH